MDVLLSDDVWAHIISLVAADVRADLLFVKEYYSDNNTFEQSYGRLHGLKLVCKKFRTIFQQHPELSACLLLGSTFSAKALMSLLERLQHDSTVVTTFIAFCGHSHKEAALAGAITASNRPLRSLSVAFLQGSSDSAPSMLALSQNLTRIDFMHFSDVDLEPLQALPNLSELTLRHGSRALGVGKLASLTTLILRAAGDVNCSGRAHFVHHLKRLSVSDSTVKGLHELGVTACSGLQHLTLDACEILAPLDQYAVNIYYDGPHALTMHMSSLTQLTNLELDGTISVGVECPWLFTLTNLVCLKLAFESGVTQYNLTDQLGVLHCLEHFDFKLGAPAGSMLTLATSWDLMPVLQTVRIVAVRLRVDERVLGLAKLSVLKCLEVTYGELDDMPSEIYFASMVCKMAAHRPQVVCELHHLSPYKASEYFDNDW
ncbi:hypothetical protein ABBQ38_007936 [Trebouxia sp. C0009 RCD-2024]